MKEWLDKDPKNVIAVHCKGGKGITSNTDLHVQYIIHSLLRMPFNPLSPEGSPCDEFNRLALARVKSIKTLLGLKGLRR